MRFKSLFFRIPLQYLKIIHYFDLFAFSVCPINIQMVELMISFINQFIKMDRARKLQGEPYMQQIKKLIKPLYMSQIEQAIDDENEQTIQKLLYKYLRKRQAQEYFPKIIIGIREHKKKNKYAKSFIQQQEESWDKIKIIQYLKDKLEADQLNQVCQLIQSGSADLCLTLANDYLRFQQAEELVPHLIKLFQNSKKIKSAIFSDFSPSNSKKSLFQKEYKLQSKFSSNSSYSSIKTEHNKLNKTISQQSRNARQQLINEPLFLSPLQFKPKKLTYKKENPQAEGKKQNKKDILQILQQIRIESELKKSKQKRQLLQQIKQKFDEEKQKYDELVTLLNKGKLKKSEEILKQILGKKQAEGIMKKLKQHYNEVVNRPLENAIYLRQNQDGMKFYELQTQQILDIPQQDITNVLIVGMTGVGKSTYLNAIINYFMDIDMEDNFRYVVSRDMFKNQNGKSSTNKVNIYGMPKQGKMKRAIRLIDIPGLGDTGGIMKDREHLDMIHERIQANIPFINLIIYIFKSSQTRITKETEYVIGQIMGMFAKDMGSNILFVLTFADNEEPNVIKSLKQSFSGIIQKITKQNKQWYIKVNNSALFKKVDIKNHVDTTFYMMGQKCLQKTADIMQKHSKVSTKLSLEVMDSRKQIEVAIEGLHELINSSMMKQQQIRNIAQAIVNNKDAMKNLDYKIKYKEQKIILKDTQNIVTTCMNCKFTCHKKCSRKNEDKGKCAAMKDGVCTVCPGKCSWEAHINDHKIVKRVMQEVEKNNQQLYQRYKVNQESKNKKQQLLLNLISDYSQILVKLRDFCQRLKILNEKLASIQLRMINHATVVEYIEILIINEQNQKSQGYSNRIKQYNMIKNYEIRLQSLLKENELTQIQKFKQLMENRIKQLIPDQDIAKKLIETAMKNYQQIDISKKDIQAIRQHATGTEM